MTIIFTQMSFSLSFKNPWEGSLYDTRYLLINSTIVFTKSHVYTFYF